MTRKAWSNTGTTSARFWDTVEAFRGSTGAQKGLIDALLKDPLRVRSSGRPTDAKKKKAKEDASESIKAALMINGPIRIGSESSRMS